MWGTARIRFDATDGPVARLMKEADGDLDLVERALADAARAAAPAAPDEAAVRRAVRRLRAGALPG